MASWPKNGHPYQTANVKDLRQLLKQHRVDGRSRITKKQDMINALLAQECITASDKAKELWTAREVEQDERELLRQRRLAALAENQDTGFFRLPPELRNRIYKMVLPFPYTVHLRTPNWRGRASALTIDGTLARHEPALLLVCSLSRTEAAPIFYGTQHARCFLEGVDQLQQWISKANTFAVPLLHAVRRLNILVRFEEDQSIKDRRGHFEGRAAYELINERHSLNYTIYLLPSTDTVRRGSEEEQRELAAVAFEKVKGLLLMKVAEVRKKGSPLGDLKESLEVVDWRSG